jgi:hypothetical protein
MPEQIPLEVLEAIREALEKTARRFAKDKRRTSTDKAPAQEPTDPEAGVRPH